MYINFTFSTIMAAKHSESRSLPRSTQSRKLQGSAQSKTLQRSSQRRSLERTLQSRSSQNWSSKCRCSQSRNSLRKSPQSRISQSWSSQSRAQSWSSKNWAHQVRACKGPHKVAVHKLVIHKPGAPKVNTPFTIYDDNMYTSKYRQCLSYKWDTDRKAAHNLSSS